MGGIGKGFWPTLGGILLLLYLSLKMFATCDPLTDTDNNGYWDPGDHENAIARYDEAIRLDPQHAETYNRRGIEYYAMGKYEGSINKVKRAIEDYSEAIRLNPQRAYLYSNRAQAYSKLEQYERAIEDYDEAIRLDPRSAYAYLNRGYAYGNLGQEELADRDFAKAKELGY